MKSLNKAFLGLSLLVCLLASLQSCKPSIPSQYLSKGEMESILYDFHLAEAMANVNGGLDGNTDMISYREAVFKKHGVTSAEFDSSMVYYTRHTKLLHDIYVKLGERLTAEAQAMGADVNLGQYGDISSGDTSNVWNGARSLVFTPHKPFNYYSFSVPVDTSYHKGDQLILDFDSQFLFQDGMRDGVAVLAVTFGNDSVASSNARMSGSQHYTLRVEDRDSLGIKSIKGYFLLNSGDFGSGNSSSTTLKLMFVQNIKLVRLHSVAKKEKPAVSPSPTDSSSQSDEPQPVLSAPSGRPIPPRIERIRVKEDAMLPQKTR